MNQNRKVVVTGASGKAGRACVTDLLEHGYQVLAVDQTPPASRLCPFIAADLTDFGQTIDAIGGGGHSSDIFGVVHMAAIPAPRMRSNAATYANNTRCDYNVFESCRQLGIKNIVYASSETVLGLPFDVPPPYVPVDEEYPPRPESAYSLSKVVAETSAQQYCRWDPALKMIGLRFSNIMEPADYARFASYQKDARLRKWNLWGYIDARDAAQAMRRGLEGTMTGSHVYIIANNNTLMQRTNDELLKEVFPNVPRKGSIGAHDTLLSINKARRELGYAPQFDWKPE